MRTHFSVMLLVCAALGCGGGSATAPTPAPTSPVTDTFSGKTWWTGSGCTGDSHDFTAAAGEIKVRLLETSDPAGALSVQVCAGGNDTAGNCAIRQQKIAVGQTLSGTRVGVAGQNLKLLGHNCVFGGALTTDPITYRVEVTYQR